MYKYLCILNFEIISVHTNVIIYYIECLKVNFDYITHSSSKELFNPFMQLTGHSNVLQFF